MNHPKVSVLIASYNHEEFIADTIESVLSQDYENIEIIISDDASTDRTPSIINMYHEKYPDLIKVNINETNEGVTKTCNKGLALCKGKYIAFLSGDDLMMPKKISKQEEFMEQHPECTICYHNLEIFNTNNPNESRLYNGYRTLPRQGDVSVAIKYGTFNGASSTMVRSSRIPKHGFDERFITSDWLFWIETLLNGGDIRYINDVLGKYRRHDKNITAINKYKCYSDTLMICVHIMSKYPEYTKEALNHMANTMASMRRLDKTKYSKFLRASLKIKFNMAPGILLILWYLSLGKFRL